MSLPYINIHTHVLSDNPNCISVVNVRTNNIDKVPDNKLYSIGIHPWYIPEEKNNLHKLLVNSPNCIAIGEIGLDKFSEVPYHTQLAFFEEQVKIAVSANMPIIVHSVRGTSDILQILKNTNLKFIFHGYIGNIITAKQIISHGGYISFGKAIFEHKKTIDTLAEIDSSRVFFETDDDNICISEVYLKASEITNISVEKWQEIVLDNFKIVFPSVRLE